MALIIDRSGVALDDQCHRMRWWNREEGGGGVVPAVEPVYFADGRFMHVDLQASAEAADPVAHARETVPLMLSTLTFAESFLDKERLALRAAMAASYGLFIEPWLRGYYDHVHAEREYVLRRGDLWVPCTPDRLMREKAGGKRLVYREYKSLKRVPWSWAEHWETAPQLHIGMKAVEEEDGEAVGFAQIMGVIKGEWKDGRLRHPYVWAYVDEKKDDGFMDPGNWFADYKYGLAPTPVWDYPDGIVAWVERLGIDTAWKVFPFSTPVGLNERLLETWLKETLIRERTIANMKEKNLMGANFMPTLFPHNFDRCSPSIGSRCVYYDACHNEVVGADPVGSGLYVPRQPHHELEIIGVEE